MSYRELIPDIGDEWDDYWKKTSMEEELELVKTDGLLPIFSEILPKNGKILEAGCGLGKWIVTLSQKGYDIQGVDTNQYALQKLKEFYPEAKIKTADVRDLPFSKDSFDAYLSLGVVEHFEEGPDQAIKEAFRVLTSGGVAIIEVPFDSPLRKLMRSWNRIKGMIKAPAKALLEGLGIRKPRPELKMRFYEYRYEAGELESFAINVGFKDVKILPKDDLAGNRSIALWLDFPRLQRRQGKIFELNAVGKFLKKILESISPFTYCALIVAVARKS